MQRSEPRWTRTRRVVESLYYHPNFICCWLWDLCFPYLWRIRGDIGTLVDKKLFCEFFLFTFGQLHNRLLFTIPSHSLKCFARRMKRKVIGNFLPNSLLLSILRFFELLKVRCLLAFKSRQEVFEHSYDFILILLELIEQFFACFV